MSLLDIQYFKGCIVIFLSREHCNVSQTDAHMHITTVTELTWKQWLQSKRASGWGHSTNNAVKQKTDLLALGTS